MKIWESATLYFLLKFPKLCQVYEIKKNYCLMWFLMNVREIFRIIIYKEVK